MLFLLGGLFVLVTLLLPRGIVGTSIWWGDGRRGGRGRRCSAKNGPVPVRRRGPAE